MDHSRDTKAELKAKFKLGPFDSFREVENVTLCRRGDKLNGTLYLAEHHIVFSWSPDDISAGEKARQRQIWISYPLISHCTFRPQSSVVRRDSFIRLQCHDFTFTALQIIDENIAREVFESIRSLTCLGGNLEKLHAFSYKCPAEELRCNGWEIYDARKEYRRLGIGPKETDKGWRISDINHDYTYSPTYPATLVVPSTISDNVLKYAGGFRSKVRIPALTYLHPLNNCSITRSSQPLVGLFKGKRNLQDERLIQAIFATNRPKNDALDSDLSATLGSVNHASSETVHTLNGNEDPPQRPGEADSRMAKVYGAQQRNLIIDARPILNARANQVAGMGSENMEYYKDATINFLGIDNINVMRDSINRIVDALQHSDYTNLGPDQDLLSKSRWLKYISLVVRGAELVARQIAINHSHVLIHCSDGWDRTSQISSLAQICLDPYYRTFEGFMILIEKDWLSFGHMFRRRCGPLGHDKYFDIENDRARKEVNANNVGPTAVNALENAFSTARGFFIKKTESKDNLTAADVDLNGPDASPARTSLFKDDKYATKPHETSPIFHQFLDAVWQFIRQFPNRFEFNERFLRRLLYHLYSCQYGTFLFESERERMEWKCRERTRSVWDYFLARKELFTNREYDSTIDDKVVGKERLILPDAAKVRWWSEVFGRSDEEMNGTVNAPAISLPKDIEPVVTGIESSDISIKAVNNGDDTSDSEVSHGRLTASKLSTSPSGSTLACEDHSSEQRGSDNSFSNFTSLSLGDVKSSPASTRKKVDNTTSDVKSKSVVDFASFARDSAFRD